MSMVEKGSGERHIRGRGACRRLGVSSCEATSFGRRAVEVNCLIGAEIGVFGIALSAPSRGALVPDLIAIVGAT